MRHRREEREREAERGRERERGDRGGEVRALYSQKKEQRPKRKPSRSFQGDRPAVLSDWRNLSLTWPPFSQTQAWLQCLLPTGVKPNKGAIATTVETPPHTATLSHTANRPRLHTPSVFCSIINQYLPTLFTPERVIYLGVLFVRCRCCVCL